MGITNLEFFAAFRFVDNGKKNLTKKVLSKSLKKGAKTKILKFCIVFLRITFFRSIC